MEGKTRELSDLLGIVCSVGCAIHCAATPILLIALPSVTSVRWMASPIFHQVVAVVCGVVAITAILPGFRKHKNWAVPALASIGFGCLMVAGFVLPDRCCQTESTPSTAIHLVSTTMGSSASDLERTRDGISHHDCEYCRAKSAEKILVSEECGQECECSAHGHSHAGLGGSLLSAAHLESMLGESLAGRVMGWQPWMTPLGGVFLILAHALNLRLGFGCRPGCKGH